MTFSPHTCISLLCFCCWCLQVSAQSADSVRKELALEDVVITAQYEPTHIQHALHDVTLIQAQEIRRMGFTHLNELLANQLNLQVGNDMVLGSTLRMQGIGGENVQVMIDGIPVIGRNNGNIDLGQINVTNVQRVEIVQGALSTQFGSNASGGVINIITDPATPYRWEISAQNQYETVGAWNQLLGLKGSLGKWSAGIQASRYDVQIQPDDSLRLYQTLTNASGTPYKSKKYPWNPKLQYGLGAMLRYRWRDSLDLTYQFRWFDEEVRALGEIRRPQFQPYAFDQFFLTGRQDHNLQFKGYLSNRWFLHTWLAYNEYNRQHVNKRFNVEGGETLELPAENDTAQFTSWLHRGILSRTSRSAWSYQLGWEWQHETGKGERIVDSTSRPYDQAHMHNLAGWASMIFQPASTLKLMASLRTGYNSQYTHPWIPSFNMMWQAAAQWKVRLSYARGFRAPSLKELHLSFIDANHFILGNTDLDAEYSDNASLSLAYASRAETGGRLQGKLRFFYNHIQDRIVLAQFDNAQFSYRNIDQFKTHGASLEMSWASRAGWNLSSGMTYTRVSNPLNGGVTASEFSGLFEMQNQLTYTVQPLKTHLQLSHRLVGKQLQYYLNDLSEAEEGYIGGYNLLNGSAGRDFWGGRIALTAGVKNILDVQRVEVVGSGGGIHGGGGDSQLLNWGRSYFLNLGLKLNSKQPSGA